MFDNIDKDDPFLLSEESQNKFGQALINNILVGRTEHIIKPRIIDLHAPAESQDAKPKPPPLRPSPEAKQKYIESRLLRQLIDPGASTAERKKLTKDLREVTMMARGELTERRVRDVVDNGEEKKQFSAHDEARLEVCHLDGRLRVAAIGFRVKMSKLVDDAYIGEDLCFLKELPEAPQEISGVPDKTGIDQLGRTTLTPDAKRDRWTQTVVSHIGKAIERGSHIIVAPEFGFPPEITDAGLESQIQKCCENAAATNKREHFVFAGTRHEGGYNRGLVVHIKEEKTEAKTDWHYKIASARKLGENILGPRSNGYAAYEANLVVGNAGIPSLISVAICYDTFDPTIFLSLVRNSAQWRMTHPDAIQIILVPSFNPSSEFVELLRDLSFLTASTVVYVNALHGDARMFVAGFSIGKLVDRADGRDSKGFNDFIDKMHKEIRKTTKAHDEARAKGNLREANAAKERNSVLSSRIRRLQSLQNGIEALSHNGGLKHLITVEGCDACKNGSHSDDYDCPADILYYNIDMRLLTFLPEFRERYFSIDDSFLPIPFRSTSLSDMIRASNKPASPDDED